MKATDTANIIFDASDIKHPYNKSFKFVAALRASTGPKKAAPFWAA